MEDDVSDHFSYLTESDTSFFQEAACEKVDEAPVIEKTALDKFAARIDRDLEIMKTAGRCGMDFGNF